MYCMYKNHEVRNWILLNLKCEFKFIILSFIMHINNNLIQCDIQCFNYCIICNNIKIVKNCSRWYEIFIFYNIYHRLNS
jgi:hypothetical protein